MNPNHTRTIEHAAYAANVARDAIQILRRGAAATLEQRGAAYANLQTSRAEIQRAIAQFQHRDGDAVFEALRTKPADQLEDEVVASFANVETIERREPLPLPRPSPIRNFKPTHRFDPQRARLLALNDNLTVFQK